MSVKLHTFLVALYVTKGASRKTAELQSALKAPHTQTQTHMHGHTHTLLLYNIVVLINAFDFY